MGGKRNNLWRLHIQPAERNPLRRPENTIPATLLATRAYGIDTARRRSNKEMNP